jgi:hypothetical protein
VVPGSAGPRAHPRPLFPNSSPPPPPPSFRLRLTLIADVSECSGRHLKGVDRSRNGIEVKRRHGGVRRDGDTLKREEKVRRRA